MPINVKQRQKPRIFETMKLLFPEVLWALFALSLPVIIHLFSFRTSKKVYFSDIRWLQLLQQQTNQRSRLRHLLVLLMRCLAITALVFAFAQPYFPAQIQRLASSEAVSVYIDNSASMALSSEVGVNLEQAKAAAVAIAKNARPDDRFQLIRQESSMLEMRSMTREQFIEAVDATQSVSTSRPLSLIASRQNEWLKAQERQGRRIWLSDFQQGSQDFESIVPDTSYATSLFQFKPVAPTNLYIDTAWLSSPVVTAGKTVRLLYKVVNSGSEARTSIRVSLEINGIQKGLSTLDLAAGQTIVDTIDFSPAEFGWQKAALVLEDQLVTFDDRYFLSFDIKAAMDVLVITEQQPNAYIKALLGSDDFIRPTYLTANQLDYNRIKQYPVIVLDHLNNFASGLQLALSEAVNAGATLLYFPDAEFPQAGNDLLTQLGLSGLGKVQRGKFPVRSLALQHELFQETFSRLPEQPDLPEAVQYLPYLSPNPAISLLGLNNRDALVSTHKSGEGRLLQFHVPLDPAWSNLQQHALFVPLVYRSILLSGGIRPLSYRLGKTAAIFLRLQLPAQEVFELSNDKNRYIPELRRQQGTVSLQLDELQQAGWYALKSSKSDTVYAWLAVNADKVESELVFMTDETLEQESKRLEATYFSFTNAEITPQLVQNAQSNPLWKWFLAAVLVFLMAEILLLKFWK